MELLLTLLGLYRDIDFKAVKVSHAVAIVETGGCRAGVGRLNNCHGLRNGSIAPCPSISDSGFCIYEHPIQSYIAFYRVWTQGYKGGLPTKAKAIQYTNNPNTDWEVKVNNLIK